MDPDLRHIHGGSPRLQMERLGVRPGPVSDFSVNLNPLGPPALMRERWLELFEGVEHYPSVEGEGIARYYGSRYGIAPRNVLAGNGSTELIYLIPRVLGFRRAAVLTPSFYDYERASLLAGAEVIRYPLFGREGFALPAEDELKDLIRGVDAIWIGRPNNPTGNLLPRRSVLDLAGSFPGKWFIIDEAFIQFTDAWPHSSLLAGKPLPNVLVLNSLTKFYALAGLRLGGVVGSEDTVSRLKRAKEPWTVNGIADRVAPLLSRCADYDEKTRLVVRDEMGKLFSGLKDLEGVIPFPASANFILCQWLRTNDLDDLLRHLLANGVYVRDCRNFPGLEENFFRVGLKGPEDNQRLLSLISSFEPLGLPRAP
ncbi:MAG: threonine-phosphate decarboxylase [Deltaproteobacteria bacterium]|nr:threonine-phosphate decarboxylase [Deltaproteobacteria bacterium]MBW2112964.1 threonine-phosphate decarboxylase [Deltaproteobacteria bacterium]